ncbi:hypothetical protein LCGC14_0195750 [marine sediment metagenome]|uniref:Uncharacterized protein n=1 Tax=marine sediment metagenome TaxID=412755 RepID=A0A0F9V1Z4_9ZZZZ
MTQITKINYNILEDENTKISIKEIIKMLGGLCKVCDGLVIKFARSDRGLSAYVCERYDQGANKKADTTHYWDSMMYRHTDGDLMFFLRKYKIIIEE